MPFKECPNGIDEFTIDVDLKPDSLASMKSTNYLLNAKLTTQAQLKGGYLGIWVKDDVVYEQSVANIAIYKEHSFKTPPLRNILAGTTRRQVIDHLRSKAMDSNSDGRKNEEISINKVEESILRIQDLLSADEVLSMGGHDILAITKVNGKIIGDGKPGKMYH